MHIFQVEAFHSTKLAYPIRHPVDVFRSAWDYLNWDEFYNMTLPQFADNINTSTGKLQLQINHHYEYLNHLLLYDFGIPKQKINDLKFIDAKIREIDDNFNLILIQAKLFYVESFTFVH